MGPNLKELQAYAAKKEKEKQALEKIMKEEALKPKPAAEPEKKEEKPKQVIQDDTGRLRDEKGNIINIKPTAVSSLKININRAKEQRVKEMLKYQRTTAVAVSRDSKLYDRGLFVTTAVKRERKKNHAFHFIEKGSIIKKAEAFRKKLQAKREIIEARRLQRHENQLLESQMESGKEGELDPNKDVTLNTNVINMGLKRVSVRIKHHDPIPDLEWWDMPLMPTNKKTYLPFDDTAAAASSQAPAESRGDKNEELLKETHMKNIEFLDGYQYDETAFNVEKMNHLIEHPQPFKIATTSQNVVMPMYLTKQERKKIRRQKRAEREKEKQDKIRLGLMKAPPPKVKLANMMRVLTNEAVADPSKMEAEVKRTVAERLRAHLERNESRKLTKEQRAEKWLRKLRRDSAAECRVALFRVEDLQDRRLRFKVDRNALQLALHGLCLISDRRTGLNLPNLVLVEGGPKAINFYKKLMLRRIKWENSFKVSPTRMCVCLAYYKSIRHRDHRLLLLTVRTLRETRRKRRRRRLIDARWYGRESSRITSSTNGESWTCVRRSTLNGHWRRRTWNTTGIWS
eukprot:TRINITY_DN4017_c0_g1_i4.p1 TRINITY_DN4017_c0_g1~~TRINITY_DN4017_c0_g1_i4.p1  ORF type:complete len:570 (-),score=144.49 TRINITY_DN4017_c0_g1_i4:201-1910(-)